MFKKKKEEISAKVEEDSSGCIHMEGLLSKPSRLGISHELFYFLNNGRLLFKTTQSSAATEAKLSISCYLITSCIVLDKKITIEMPGEEHQLKAPSKDEAVAWGKAINERVLWVKSHEDSTGAHDIPLSEMSDCTPMAGPLSKLTEKGSWHERYFFLRSGAFLHQHTKISPASDIKMTISCNLISSCIAEDIHIYITLYGGDKFHFKASNKVTAERWSKCLNERAQWSVKQAGSSPFFNLAGWIKKKSGNVMNASTERYQDRYLRIDGNNLKYFKHAHDAVEVGSLDLATAEYVRPFDLSHTCTTFEMEAIDFHDNQNRIYVFQAETPNDMKVWVTAIESVIQSIKFAANQAEKSRIEA